MAGLTCLCFEAAPAYISSHSFHPPPPSYNHRIFFELSLPHCALFIFSLTAALNLEFSTDPVSPPYLRHWLQFPPAKALKVLSSRSPPTSSTTLHLDSSHNRRSFTQPSILHSTVDFCTAVNPSHGYQFFTRPSTHELDRLSYPQAVCIP